MAWMASFCRGLTRFCCSCFSSEADNSDTSEKAPLLSKGSSKPEAVVVQPRINKSTVQPRIEPPKLINKSWYHGSISEQEAEHRLGSVAKGIRAKGTFLVYCDSSTSTCVLRVFKKHQRRCRIRDRGGSEFVLEVESEETATLNPKSHSSVIELIKHHKGLSGTPIKLSETESVRLRDCATVPS